MRQPFPDSSSGVPLNEEALSVGRHWAPLAWLTAANVGGAYAIGMVGALGPLLRNTEGISRSGLGIWASSGAVGQLLVSLFVGPLIDRLPVSTPLLLGLGISGLATGLNHFVGAPWQGLILMLFVGAGWSIVTPASTKAILDSFQPQHRARAMGVKQTGVAIGGALAATIMPTIALAIGWRGSFLVAGAITIAFGFLVSAGLREGVRTARLNGHVSARESLSAIAPFLTDRNQLVLSAIQALFTGTQYAVQTYFALYLHEALRIPIVAAGLGLATLQVAGVLGRLSWGFVSDVLMSGRRKAAFAAVTLTAISGLVVVGCMTPRTPGIIVSAVAFLLGLGVHGWPAQFLVLRSELSRPEQVATVSSLGFVVSSWGTTLIPPLFGRGLEIGRSYPELWWLLAAILAGSLLLLMIVREPRIPGNS